MGITSFIVLLYTVVQSGEQLLVVRFMHGFSDGFLIPFLHFYQNKQMQKTRKSNGLSGLLLEQPQS